LAALLFAVAGAMALFGQKKVDVILGVVRETAGASIAETVDPILIWMVARSGSACTSRTSPPRTPRTAR